MKGIFTLFVASFVCAMSFGQSIQKIHKSDGNSIELPISGIDSIDFSGSSSPSLQLHLNDATVQQILISEIDSVTYAGSTSDTAWGNSLLISLAGQVFDENGLPLNGVAVSVGDSQTFTDINGVFYFSEVSVREELGFVTASRSGYFPGSRSFLPVSGTNTVKITLLRKNPAGTFSATSGGVVQAENANIVFMANGFIRNGLPFNGQVNVSVNYLNPESGTFDSEMPGSLLGVAGETSSRLLSYGMLAVELNDSIGNTIELASGTTAELHFPLSTALLANAPNQIDLWYFDENQGYWLKEGTATLAGNEYVAQVAHFTFWNCDKPFPYEMLKGRITDASGKGVAGARITVTSPIQGSASDYSSSTGYFGGNIPSGEILSLRISIPCGVMGEFEEISNTTIGPLSDSLTLPTILVSSALLKSVRGTISDCNNNRLKNAYLVAQESVYFPDTSGIVNFLACGDSVTLHAFGVNPFSIGVEETISLSGGSVDVGIMEVCAVAGGTVTDIDGNVYSTVVIGNQEWMAENLKTSKYADGSSIPNEISSQEWNNLSTGAWCTYNNEANNNIVYGKLYNWYSVVDSRNVCPTGWHVPSDAEWTILTDYLGGVGIAGAKMKSLTGWTSANANATNESGFSALPGGVITGTTFQEIGVSGLWWSSTDSQSIYAWDRFITNFAGSIYLGRNGVGKKYGMSVRCLKD